MRILLIVPPAHEELEIYQHVGLRAPPLGLLYIAAVLEGEGHKVGIIDAPTINLTLRGLKHFIKAWKPDLVGITSVTPTIYSAYKVADLVKEVDEEVKVIVGGPHPTFMYREVLEDCSSIDFVCIGEGEYTLSELVSVLERGGDVKRVRGIAYRSDGEIRRNELRPLIRDLNELPKPARHLLPMHKYTLFDKPVKLIHVMASRGCPFGCIYCSTSYFFGRRVRFRDADKVLDEIEEETQRYRTRNVAFTDDEFTINKKWLYEFINGLRERKLDIEWTCGSRVDTVDREMLLRMYSSGCKIIYFGVESSSELTLRLIRKRVRISQIVRVFELIKRIGGEAAASFILGMPWETIRDMKNTVKFAIKLDPDYAQFTVATPYPGTPLYHLALRRGLIVDWNWSHYTTIKPVMRGYYFNLRDLERMIGYAYAKFYFRLGFVARQLQKGRLSVLAETLKSALMGFV